MKILFTSDPHGDIEAIKKFSKLLKHYDCGIIAGDILDEFIPISDAISFGLRSEDYIEELFDAEDDEVMKLPDSIDDALHNPQSVNRIGLEMKKDLIMSILNEAKKPIFYITGNHDIAEWGNRGFMINVENTKVCFKNYSFVGFSSTNFDTSKEEEQKQLKAIEPLIDKRTIFITHSPPYGILDLTERNDKIGSTLLLDVIKKRKPFMNLFGHVHESFGRQGIFFNSSWFGNNKFMSINTTFKTMKLI